MMCSTWRQFRLPMRKGIGDEEDKGKEEGKEENYRVRRGKEDDKHPHRCSSPKSMSWRLDSYYESRWWSGIVTDHNHHHFSLLNLSPAVMRYLSSLADTNPLIYIDSLFKPTGLYHRHFKEIFNDCVTNNLNMMWYKYIILGGQRRRTTTMNMWGTTEEVTYMEEGVCVPRLRHNPNFTND